MTDLSRVSRFAVLHRAGPGEAGSASGAGQPGQTFLSTVGRMWSDYWKNLRRSHDAAKGAAGGITPQYLLELAKRNPEIAAMLFGGTAGTLLGGRNRLGWGLGLAGGGLLAGSLWANRESIAGGAGKLLATAAKPLRDDLMKDFDARLDRMEQMQERGIDTRHHVTFGVGLPKLPSVADAFGGARTGARVARSLLTRE